MRETQGRRMRGRGLLVRFAIVEVFVALTLILALGAPHGREAADAGAAYARDVGHR